MQKLTISKSMIKSLLLGAYILCVIAFSVASRADVGNFPIPKKLHPHVQVVSMVGQLLVDEASGSVFMVRENAQTVRLDVLANSDIELSAFNGQVVEVIGAFSNQRVQPVTAAIGSHVTDDETRREVATPTVFVLKINGASL